MQMMKILLASLMIVGLTVPTQANADASDVPGSASWYLHINLERMRTADAGKSVYAWLQDEVFEEVMEGSGVDLGKELDRLTAYSQPGAGPVIVVNGNISQATKDKVMVYAASGGDIEPLKSSGKTYFHVSDDSIDSERSFNSNDISIDFDSLGDEAWVSLAIKDAVLVTSNEEQMKALLANKGKIAGSRGHKGALIVLTAEKALLQAGMNSDAVGDNSDWDSNILRNTKQVAVLIAAAADKLLIEAKLVTTEPDMASSLASVARGLISLVAFNDDMDAETRAVLRGTKVEAEGNSLNISLAVDPNLVVATLRDE